MTPANSTAPLARAALAIWPMLAGNALVLLGVFFANWRTTEVLLLFWLETAVMVALLPIRCAARDGWGGGIAAAFSSLFMAIFLAFHIFFLTGLLYGADWDQATGGPGGWSVPAVGTPIDWFAAALQDLPWLGVFGIVAFSMVGLVREWPVLRAARHNDDHEPLDNDPLDSLTGGHVIVMHIAIVFGGSAILIAGGDSGMLILLIALKTAYETLQSLRSLRKSEKFP